MSRSKVALFLVSVVCGALLGLALHLRRPRWVPVASSSVQPEPLPPPRPMGYAGGEACRECHADIVDLYARHPMARSLARVANAAVIEDYEGRNVFRPASWVEYRVEKTGDSVHHAELGLDVQRSTVYRTDAAIDYVVGSGRHGRSYLIHRDGLLYISPISWYSSQQTWDLSPGYRADSNPHFQRLATDACLNCHAGRLAPSQDVVAVGHPTPRRPQAAFLEHGIGCERCHGPGRDHVDHHLRDRSGLDPIVNPIKLDPARREAVCNQCHLHGEHRVLQYGRGDADFRPGDHLADVWAVFVSPVEAAKASKSVSHVEQMRTSRCYQADPQRFSCVSCHDPHQSPPSQDKPAYYRQRCLHCHQPESCSAPLPPRRQQQDACTVCHMPRLATEDVPHTTQTDHRVLRDPSAAEPTTRPALASKATSLEIFDADTAGMSLRAQQRAETLMLVESLQWRPGGELAQDPDVLSAEGLLQQILPAYGKDPPLLHAAGAVAMWRKQPHQAVQWWRQALEVDAHRPETLFALASYLQEQGQATPAEPLWRKLCAHNAWNASVAQKHSLALAQLGRLEQAIAEAQRARRINPADPAIYAWLAELFQRHGQLDQRDQMQAMARRLREAHQVEADDQTH